MGGAPPNALDRLPQELAAALATRGAAITDRWDEGPRTYLHADSPSGRLFGRASSDPGDVATLEHEAAVRAIVGEAGPLRAPAVVAKGPDWMLEVGMTSADLRGAEVIGTVIAAAARLQSLSLPEIEDAGPQSSGGAVRRRLSLVGSGLKVRDLVAAKRILDAPSLPEVTSHGDFHIGNVFYADGALWVVDWELAGRRAAGYDLMQFWGSVDRVEDRELLFEGTVGLVGTQHRRALARLRYALLVRTIANKLGATKDYNRDEAGGRALLALLPDVRGAAS
jgi:hypothetical protein